MSIPDPAPFVAAGIRAFEIHFAARQARELVEAYYVADEHHPLASPPGDLIVRGRPALCDMFAGQFGFATRIALSTLELDWSGDIAVELGRATLDLTDGGSARGRYVAVWLWRDGRWGVKNDVFTLDG